eukprot:PhM_4_TR634/c0_g1_i1/m.96518
MPSPSEPSSSSTPRVVPFTDVRSLKSVFESWGLPAQFHEHLSPAWQCRLVCEGYPAVTPDGATSDPATPHLSERLLDESVSAPTVLTTEFSAEVHAQMRATYEEVEAAEGPDVPLDALKYWTQPKYNTFPVPRIAFVSGWAGPDTFMDDDEYCVLVKGVDDVLEDERVLNLQMFHRPEIAHLPVLVQHLKHHPAAVPVMDPVNGNGVVCDSATRLSREGALTWWHLDDGGEYVYQCALPLDTSVRGMNLVGPTGKPVVKIFVYVPTGDEVYKLVFHDAECNKSGKCVVLDLFRIPTEALPPISMLPTLTVAIIEAGGGPLLSPPNLPHLVITAQDCVMVERRTISRLNVPEVLYFRDKAKEWATRPILYPFLTEVLTSRKRVVEEVFPRIVPYLDHDEPHIRCAARRSLRALVERVLGELDAENCTCNLTLTKVGIAGDGGMLTSTGSVIDKEHNYAVVYFQGCPVFGPRRETRAEVKSDEKQMRKATLSSSRVRDPYERRADVPLWALMRTLKLVETQQ